MTHDALAQIENGTVINVISVSPGTLPEDLGLVGGWLPAEAGTVGVGFTYDAETGLFSPPYEEPFEYPIEQDPE